MKKTITLQIDVSKIDKKRLYKGAKGTYLNAVLHFNDEADQYDQNGFIAESVTKEEREQGVKGTILGNAKLVWSEDKKAVEVPAGFDEMDDSLPF